MEVERKTRTNINLVLQQPRKEILNKIKNISLNCMVESNQTQKN